MAIEEFDARGREDFLATYGFAPDTSSFVAHGGSHYDATAIFAAAYGHQHPAFGALVPADFRGEEETVKHLLEALGFDVVGPATDMAR
jgi:hypothetical protein